MAFRVQVIPLVACWLLSAAVSVSAQGTRIAGRWLGQDKHDYCGEVTNGVKPNGVQDIHIALAGLPPRSEIVFASVTGHGSDEWQFQGERQNQFSALILRKPGSTTADVFFEPTHVEKGREFCVKLRFSNNAVVEVFLKGGHADPNLRMPNAAMNARWVGQDRQDYAGMGPGVGPDGLQDAHLLLTKLSPREKIKAVLVEDPSGSRWEFGVNPRALNNAELIARENDPTEAHIYFQPDRDLSGHKLKVSVLYESAKQDTAIVAAGKTEPKLAMARPSLSRLSHLKAAARWLGQDGASVTGPGDVHVVISGLTGVKGIAGAVLSDANGRVWTYRASQRPLSDLEPDTPPLALERGNDRNSVHLYFPPLRNEAGGEFTLRLIDMTGDSHIATFHGGECDPDRRAPAVAGGEVTARPGDDLNALAQRAGSIRLTRGEYLLSRPLVLPRPITITGDRDAVLKFAQGPSEPPWTTAIKIHAGGTSLRGFTIRFAGPTRWKNDVSWGPAVIGTTDNTDTIPNTPKVCLRFEGLDIEGPPASKSTGWEEAVKLMRLLNVSHGRATGCVLRGGTIECFEGPWLFTSNDFRGTLPNTYSPSVFAVHEPHDLLIKDNRAKPVGSSGKTWRFLVLTNRGDSDRVENNTIEGIGPRDDDTIPAMNMPEIILTESYHLRYEGKPAALSPDATVLKLHPLRGEPPRTGDVVSILSGSAAGQWRRVRLRLSPTELLLDQPLPRGSDVIAVSPGFVGEVFAGNTILAPEGRAAAGFVLAGNHFGTRLADNRVVGAGDALQLMAYPSESPCLWGWSHAPFLGGRIEGNTFEDSVRGARIGVHHNEYTKTNKGRVYMSVVLKGNTVRWSERFLSRSNSAHDRNPPTGITLGFERSVDPGEMVVTESDTRLDAPGRAPASTALRVHAAQLNGKPVSERALPLRTGQASASTGLNSRVSGRANPRR